jgi:hypothetical protein
MASERPGSPSCCAAQASTFAINSSERRIARTGSFPVAGRPRLLSMTFFVDVPIIESYIYFACKTSGLPRCWNAATAESTGEVYSPPIRSLNNCSRPLVSAYRAPYAHEEHPASSRSRVSWLVHFRFLPQTLAKLTASVASGFGACCFPGPPHGGLKFRQNLKGGRPKLNGPAGSRRRAFPSITS